jgi:chlorobactene glucosyltransferase
VGETWVWWVLTAIWVAWIVSVVVRFADSRRLSAYPKEPPQRPPLVSVIIPARNEARNIARCLRAALGATWPAIEVIVVDDHSTDGTGEIARKLADDDAARHPGQPPRVRVIDAPPLPAGWFGKQWACHTGAAAAQGQILCFTDADTRHGAELLTRSVNAMRIRGAALFTVAGRQEMLTFWEKALQPFVFALMLSRYGGVEAMSRSRTPRNKIANGQFLLLTRAAYTQVGGHEAVRANVAEDLQLAQRLTALGLPVHMVLAEDHLATRMYTSLDEIRRGWRKNIYAAGRDTLPLGPVTRRILPFVFPIPALVPLIPLGIFALGALGVLGGGAIIFGAVGGIVSLLFWIGVYAYSGLNPLWGLTHYAAAAVFAWICVEAAWRGSRVEWKGRDYLSESAPS